MTLVIPARRLTKASAVLVGVFITAGALAVASNLAAPADGWGLVVAKALRQFDLDREANIPTWYQSSALLVCAGLLWITAGVPQEERQRRHWRRIALVFVGLSIDEAAALHEMTITPLRSMLGARDFLASAWVVPGTLFVLVFALLSVRFLAALPARTRWQFVAAGAIYVGSALGLECLEAHMLETSGARALGFQATSFTQESGELLGILMFGFALLSHLRRHAGDVRIIFEPSRPPVRPADPAPPLVLLAPSCRPRAVAASGRRA